ncbi:T9SS-dependent choice-of-anchor J family protein [Hymenobacter oligotrophus]|nr:choice-of-anchor J domain-containing protein [Hymenobacter oligotrophus]
MLTFASKHAWAQVTPVALTTGTYSQNFDGLANSGTTNDKTTLPQGWDFVEANAGTGTGANNQFTADNGAANGGNTYSYGATGTTDRALGSLQSSSLVSTLGGAFVNNTGAEINSLTITYTGETWRIGGNNRQDKLEFSYSTDATSLSTGTWNKVTELDYANASSPTTNTAGVSSPIHTATLTRTITDLKIAPGASFWIRWNDLNAAGSDDGTAIDDFSLTWTNTAANSPALTVSATAFAFTGQTVSTTSAAQSYTVTAANLTTDVTVTATGPFQVSKDNTTFASTLTLTPAELGSAQTLYVRFAPTAGGPATGSISHNTTGVPARTVALTGTGVDPNRLTFNFQACGTSGLPDGWTQFSVAGAQTWACTNFGRLATDPRGSAPSGVQISGFASSTNNVNEDWLISPALNTSSFNFPLLSFWSRSAFAGAPLQLRVSTNYSGTGDPNAAGVTWTALNGDFPRSASDVWTQTANVDLSAYKGTNVYVAFVYTSTATASSRWTLDDIEVVNSNTAAPVVVRAMPGRLNFNYTAPSAEKTQALQLSARNLGGDVTITSSNAAFTVSKNGAAGPFTSTVTLTRAEVQTTPNELMVQFKPTAANTNYTGNLSIATPGATAISVPVFGDSYMPNATLDVVNWNIEWFGATGNGPSNEAQQEANAKKVLTDLNADVYGLAEIVDTAKLGAIVRQLPGGYRYSVSTGVSGSFNSSQKLVFVYRTATFANATFTTMSTCTSCADPNAWASNWSSGRVPYLMEADVKLLNGQTRRVALVLVHAKANENDGGDSYNRRKGGADALKAELDARFASSNVAILGDFNDDLDVTIANVPNVTASSYQAFVLDAAQYSALTLPLSQGGLQSTTSYGDVIDHVVVSNELNTFYLEGSASIRTDIAATVTDFANSTSDHYPVQTRFNLGANVVTSGKAGVAAAKLGLYPNPVSKSVRVEVPERGQNLQLQVLTADGRVAISAKGSLEQLNQQLNQKVGNLNAGMYTVRIVGEQQTYVERFVKQ